MSVPQLGDYDTTETVVIPFNSFSSNDPSASVTLTDLIATDVEIYKDGSLTERDSATHSGIAVDVDVDATAGAHWVTIDLSDNDDAGFYVAGSRYVVKMVGVTIDGAPINAWIGSFSIGITLRPTTAGRTLTVESDGVGHADVKEWIGTAVTLSAGTNQPEIDIASIDNDATAPTQLKTLLSNFAANGDNVGALVTGMSPDVLTASALAADAVIEIQVGLATDVLQDRNMDLTQHLRGFHAHQGATYYVAPVNGNDSTGTGTRALPYKTLQNAITDLITSGNHDTIIVLADAAPGVTTHTSTTAIVCNKRYFSILGPGRDLIITRSTNGPTFQITADGIELSGFQLGSDGASATSSGVDIAVVDFHRIHNIWFLDTQGDGIHCERGSNCHFHDNHFEGTGVAASGQGVHISGAGGAGNANDNEIYDNHFAGTVGTAILIDDGTTDDTAIYRNTIHNSGGWGIDITASSDDVQIHDNILGNNASGDIRSADPTAIIRNNREWTTPTVETTEANVTTTLDISAGGEAGVDWDNVGSKTATVALPNTTVGIVTLVTTTTTNTDTAATLGNPAGASVSADIAEVLARGNIAWLTGGGTGLTPLASGTAQSGTSTTIVLADAETFADNELLGNTIGIHTGTGAGQSREISANVGSTDTVTVAKQWTTTPAADSQYEIWHTKASITITPIASTVSPGLVTEGHVAVFTDSAPTLTFSITDSDDNAVDMSGVDIVVKVQELDQQGSDELFTRSSTSGDISVSGDDSNQVAVTFTVANLVRAGSFRYALHDTTNDLVRARGNFGIVAVPSST